MSGYSVRLATPSDAEAICRIYNQGIEDRLARERRAARHGGHQRDDHRRLGLLRRRYGGGERDGEREKENDAGKS